MPWYGCVLGDSCSSSLVLGVETAPAFEVLFVLFEPSRLNTECQQQERATHPLAMRGMSPPTPRRARQELENLGGLCRLADAQCLNDKIPAVHQANGLGRAGVGPYATGAESCMGQGSATRYVPFRQGRQPTPPGARPAAP
jgi:hypothetical protein